MLVANAGRVIEVSAELLSNAISGIEEISLSKVMIPSPVTSFYSFETYFAPYDAMWK